MIDKEYLKKMVEGWSVPHGADDETVEDYIIRLVDEPNIRNGYEAEDIDNTVAFVYYFTNNRFNIEEEEFYKILHKLLLDFEFGLRYCGDINDFVLRSWRRYESIPVENIFQCDYNDKLEFAIINERPLIGLSGIKLSYLIPYNDE